jgi:thiamine-monophosphate kinase
VTEWQIIERYFRALGAPRADVVLGIGDDAAVLRMPAEHELVLTTDALIEGVHFLSGAPPRSLGHRSLAVNLSDIAAMAASPRWALLSLNLPQADEHWLEEFASGFGALANAHGVALVGGNLGRGPLSITVQMAGVVPAGAALRRDTAQIGDDIYVSGSLGDASLGCALGPADLSHDPDAAYLRQRFEYPTPRVALGAGLRGMASACIDVSDGLYADAERLLSASGCGALLQIDDLPLSAALRRVSGDDAWRVGLQGGEDYELCFTAAPAMAPRIAELAMATGQAVTRIGSLQAAGGITLRSGDLVMQFSASGFDHFRDELNAR